MPNNDVKRIVVYVLILFWVIGPLVMLIATGGVLIWGWLVMQLINFFG